MYLIGRPLMPPLSLTHLKYAAAIAVMPVKTTPGWSVAIAPSLIGAPVAFLPLPRPQTLFLAEAAPAPTLVAGVLPVLHAASSSAATAAPATATPTLNLLDLIAMLLLLAVLRTGVTTSAARSLSEQKYV